MRSTPRPAGRCERLPLRRLACATAVSWSARLLVACGGDDDSGATTINLYLYPDNSGAVQKAVDNCNRQQRRKLRRSSTRSSRTAPTGSASRWCAGWPPKDSGMDILGLDVTWAPEFAEAGWIREWTGENKAQAERGTLEGPLADRDVQGQALRRALQQQHPTALVPHQTWCPTPPKTWDEMIDMASISRSRASRTTSRSRATSTRASRCGSTRCSRAPAAACSPPTARSRRWASPP